MRGRSARGEGRLATESVFSLRIGVIRSSKIRKLLFTRLFCKILLDFELIV